MKQKILIFKGTVRVILFVMRVLQVLQFGNDRQITLLTKTAVLYFDNFSGGGGVLAIVSIYFLILFEKLYSNKCF